jgi:hypothetical protein
MVCCSSCRPNQASLIFGSSSFACVSAAQRSTSSAAVNLFDHRYYANIFNSTGNYNNQLATQVLLPRDVARYAGIRASYNF